MRITPSGSSTTVQDTGAECARSCTSASNGSSGRGPVQVGADVATSRTPARSAVPMVTVRLTGSMLST